MANQYKNKVIYNGTTLMDISDTTAIASDVGLGKEFYTASGAKAQGTAVTGNAISVVDTTDTNGGTIRTITAVDISDTTAVAADVASGKYFYTANGTKTLGTASGGSGSSATLITKTIVANGTYSAQDDSADGYSSVTVNVPTSGGGGSSGTQHTILFEFEDETTTTITAYYDSTFISSAITATTPTTYDSKTVEQASLDGVAWYIKPSEDWEVLLDGSVTFGESSPYNSIWISSLGSLHPAVGEVYRVTIDGTVYNLTAHENDGVVYIGNPLYDWGTDDGSAPFCLFNNGYGALQGWTELSATAHTVKIERQVLS
jgi:hypothetical protein